MVRLHTSGNANFVSGDDFLSLERSRPSAHIGGPPQPVTLHVITKRPWGRQAFCAPARSPRRRGRSSGRWCL